MVVQCMSIDREKLLYPFYVMIHPFDGFYEVRNRNKGSVAIALILVFLFGLSFSLRRNYAGFVVNFVDPRSVDSRTEIIAVFLAVFLFAISNWSITSLTEGEGRFKDILVVIGYSLLPMILTYTPAIVISWFIAQGEGSYYYLLINAATLFTVILMIIGIMTIHNYTFGKTLITIVFTFIALLLILFLILLLFFLIQQVWLFIQSLYIEMILRV